ncbi:MAG: hypothetical protein M1821_006998 [Bathelium mastoideum]|nr:MAG: hypothetical protein M1821_006998 [Bathelium mastoideum]
MGLLARFCAGIASLLHLITFSLFNYNAFHQIPLLKDIVRKLDVSSEPLFQHTTSTAAAPSGPIFKAPGGVDTNFQCDYSKMVGFRSCSTPEDRSCWLTDDKGTVFDINTDYESIWPQGIVRPYTLDVYDGVVNADGIDFPDAKLFNNRYPASTGMEFDNFSRCITTELMDVSGITLITPFNTQTASLDLWLTLHGPNSYPFDEAADLPTLLSDWYHNSAFAAQYDPPGPLKPTLLLNGTGNVTRFNYANTSSIPLPYTLVFEKQTDPRPKRYLLRLINVSFDTTFIFSIDNHLLRVISADFVPIRNYTKSSVLIGIGQRYNVIVDADPLNAPVDMKDFWIRAQIADCFFQTHDGTYPDGYDKAGILRYDGSSTSEPTSRAWTNFNYTCSDEPYSKLHPIVPWIVGDPANNQSVGDNPSVGEQRDVTGGTASWPRAGLDLRNHSSPTFNPLRINYGDPTFLNLNKTSNWSDPLVIVPESYFEIQWIYLVITSDYEHPIHLHGHDFALLNVTTNATFNASTVELNLINPPRRDVVLLPEDGFVVIAFKADNPGSWLMHCHIAAHAGMGLALQILERQADANAFWPVGHSAALKEAERVCGNWISWQKNCTNWWPGDGTACPKPSGKCILTPTDDCFQDDSGI